MGSADVLGTSVSRLSDFLDLFEGYTARTMGLEIPEENREAFKKSMPGFMNKESSEDAMV